jgi:hypothetical protein
MKLFTVKLTDVERAGLEAHRARLGLRSHAEVIRHWIGVEAEAVRPDIAGVVRQTGQWPQPDQRQPESAEAEAFGPARVEARHNPAKDTRLTGPVGFFPEPSASGAETQAAEPLPVGSVRKRMKRDGKSGAPLAVREKLVRYDRGEAVWKEES